MLPKLELETKEVLATGIIRFCEEDEARLRARDLLTSMSDLGSTGIISLVFSLQRCRIVGKHEGLRLVVLLAMYPASGITIGLQRLFGANLVLYDEGDGRPCAVIDLPRKPVHNPQQYLTNKGEKIAHAIAEIYFEATSPE